MDFSITSTGIVLRLFMADYTVELLCNHHSSMNQIEHNKEQRPHSTCSDGERKIHSCTACA